MSAEERKGKFAVGILSQEGDVPELTKQYDKIIEKCGGRKEA